MTTPAKPNWSVYENSDEGIHILREPDGMIVCEQIDASSLALLRSAPALYAALEGLLLNAPQPDKDIRKSYSYRVSIEAARAALALARGEKGESK